MTSRSILGRGGLTVLLTLIGCAPDSRDWADLNEDGAFLMYRRQSLIGEETFSITSDQDSIVVRSLQGENERGRITGVQAELRLGIDLSPALYVNQRIADSDTTNILEIAFESDVVTIREKAMEVVTASSAAGFPLHSNIPAAMEMMLYHYYLDRGIESLPTLPRGEVRITRRGQDVVDIDGAPTTLDRYVVEGINWGLRTIWLNDSNDLVALVQANTQFREAIRKGYEEALPFFIEGNVEEQMRTLADYTESLQGEQAEVTALVGGDVVDALSDVTRRDMTVIVAKGRISEIGSTGEVVIPSDARVIDVSGKTIRDLGNELEFATAFRDAVANDGAMGPDILLAGMVDGAGVTGNGVIRATTTDEARSVVARYFDEGYKQIKIYTAVEPEVLSVLTEEAHARGMTVSGHVPRAVGNAVEAVERGMDQFNHRELFLSVLFPDEEVVDLGGLYLFDRELTRGQIRRATSFFLEHGIVLDPTISLDIIRNLPRGTPVETVEPDVTRIAYELWEGKRFLPGVSPLRAAQMTEDVKRAMEIIGTFHRAGVPIVAGTDNVVPVFSLYREMEAYHDLGGLTPLDALRTATIIPARAMGMASETGTLEVGKEADIAILDRNPLDDFANIRSVSAVMTNGRYYQSAPLWRAADFEPGRN
jgi:hypothetical protein